MSVKTENKKTDILLGAIIGIVTFALFVFIFAGVMLIFKIDRAYAAVFATLSVASGGFASSFYTAKRFKEKGYLIGIVTGFIYFAVVCIVSAIVCKTGFSGNTVFHLLIILLSSVIGGIAGVAGHNKKLI